MRPGCRSSRSACVALGLADFNPSVRRFHVDRVKHYLDLALRARGEESSAGARRVHLAAGGDPPADSGTGRWSSAAPSGDYAASLGLEIALELEPFHLRSSTTSTRWPGSSTTWVTRR